MTQTDAAERGDVGLSVEQGPWGITVTGTGYRLEVDGNRPVATLRDRTPEGGPGKVWSELSLLAAMDLVDRRDESYDIAPARVVETTDETVELVVDAASSVWRRKSVHVRCTAAEVEVWASAAGMTRAPDSGAARLRDVTLLGGRAVMSNGAGGTFRSAIRFASLFSPTPTEPVHVVRPAYASSSLGVVGDAQPGRLHGIFSPPPLCWAMGDRPADGATDVPAGRWWGLSVCAPVDALTMTAVRYLPLDGGFVVRFDYEGHTVVARQPGGGVGFHTPSVVLRPAESPWTALSDYRDDLVERGYAPATSSANPGWWAEPIFCGWGAQCARAAKVQSGETSAGEVGLVGGTTAAVASHLARQNVYDEFISVLDEAGLSPGTVVIDDRWQAAYGTGDVDVDHWPDLRQWIADQHAAGRRVLLWWKAWDPQGLPAEECITDPAGRPVATDVANPAYLERLRGIVTGLLGPDGLDADGFKIDFTQRAPSGESLRGADGPWGIAALHRLLETISDAAKQAKPDSLVITHTPHPSFGDVCDMVRLNDVLERDSAGDAVHVVEQLRFRHAVAERSLPGHLIDTDQWPMPDRESWLAYVAAQADLGEFSVPALYYLESIDASGEDVTPEDLELVARSWADYRARARAAEVI